VTAPVFLIVSVNDDAAPAVAAPWSGVFARVRVGIRSVAFAVSAVLA
jgi:hypothetical protein